MTLEVRSLRDRYLHHLVLDGDLRRHLVPEPPLSIFTQSRCPCHLVYLA